ncbi:MAG: hypothetical protein OHK0039_48160 [Bacteroidia bacterium]
MGWREGRIDGIGKVAGKVALGRKAKPHDGLAEDVQAEHRAVVAEKRKDLFLLLPPLQLAGVVFPCLNAGFHVMWSVCGAGWK